ncbi:hypothetical protein VNO80_06468 [Phaseolus coccineus]|uniref:Uncharacterized protein n=1 Tax=Phaseolus coccineus TaxID=3886 RepID=A0AAN9NLQ0_PHACN
MVGGVELAEAYVLRKQHRERMKETEKRRSKMGGYGLAEAYVTRKLYKEKLKKRAQEEDEQKKTNMMKISSKERDFDNKTSSGCFSWVSKHHQSKNSRISDYNHAQSANS